MPVRPPSSLALVTGIADDARIVLVTDIGRIGHVDAEARQEASPGCRACSRR